MAHKSLVDIDMDGNKITDLAIPTDNNDAASKIYVDGWTVRRVRTVTTESLAQNASDDLNAELAVGYRLLKVETDKPARVQVYASEAHRTADSAREIGTDPEGNHGVVLDLVTTDEDLEFILSPQVDGASMEDTPSVNIPIRVTNLDDTTGTVTVNFTWVRTGMLYVQ